MKFLKLLAIPLISFFLIILIDFFFGKYIINFIFVNNKPVIENSIYHHDLRKNINKKQTYNKIYNYILCTNEYGFKSDCGGKKYSKKIDYAFIGDSFTEGVGLNYGDTFVGLFSQSKKNKSVANLGVESYSPKIYYKKLEYLLDNGFQFNRVIVFLDLADIFDENLYFIQNNNIKEKGSIKSINTIYQNYDNLFKFKKILKEKFPLSFLFFSSLKKINFKDNSKEKIIQKSYIKDNYLINSRWTYANKFSKKDDPWINNGIKESKIYLNKIFELSKKNNFKLSLAVYPWPAQILFDEDTGRKKFGNIWKNFCIEKCEYFINYLDKFHDLKTKIGKTEVVEKYYLKDDVHFNKKGNLLISNFLKEIF